METKDLAPYLRSAFNSKRLAKDEEARLFEEYRDNGNIATKEKIFNAHLRLVVFFAKRFSRAQPDLFDDFLNEGSIVLLEAIDEFDPQRGFRFSTFARDIVRGAIARYFGRQCKGPITIPEETRFLARRVQRITDHLTAVSEGVTDERLMADADLTPKQLRRVRSAERAMNPDRMDAPIVNGHDGAMRWGDLMTDENPSPEESAILADTRARVQGVVDRLPERDRGLIEARYGNDLSNLAIGTQFGMSRDAARKKPLQIGKRIARTPVVQALA